MDSLSAQDWEFYILTLRGKDVLTKTFKKYVGETKKLLRYFGLPQAVLEKYREKDNPLKRKLAPRPKKEICALEWSQVQRICEKACGDDRRRNDNLLGRAILTFAFTTGARVGSLLPPRYGQRRRDHLPITRTNVR